VTVKDGNASLSVMFGNCFCFLLLLLLLLRGGVEYWRGFPERVGA